MESASKAAIIGAFVTAIGAIVVALISRSPDPSPPPHVAVCDPIPAVEQLNPKPREGFVWVPTDFEFSLGRFEAVQGHWEQKKADGRNRYIAGHWETGAGRCVWVRGEFAMG